MKTRAYIWLAALAICASAAQASAAEPRTVYSQLQKVGQGSARVFVGLDAKGAPRTMGVTLDGGALMGLPAMPNQTSRCFQGHCLGDYELVFALPPAAAKAAAPFKWIGLNWNPHGHMPPAPPAWSEPHFDFHFYTAEREAITALRAGSCGELIDCEDFKKATKPVPAAYMHADHINVDAAVPAMGNHLINSKAPELAPGGPKFTHTFIFGALDGRVAFYEPMITLAYLTSRPNTCVPIKQPTAWVEAGYYPTQYCIRRASRSGVTVTLEGFVRRSAG
jgi:hypothetical protein